MINGMTTRHFTSKVIFIGLAVSVLPILLLSVKHSQALTNCTDGMTYCGFVAPYNPNQFDPMNSSLYGVSWCSIYGSGGQGGQACDGNGKLTYVNPNSGTNWHVNDYRQGYVPSSDIYNYPYYNYGFFKGMSVTAGPYYVDDGGNYYINPILNGSNESCGCFHDWGAQSHSNCGGTAGVNSKNGTANPGQPVNITVINACAPNGWGRWGGGSLWIELNSVTQCRSSLDTSGTSTVDYPPYVQHGVNYVPTAPGVCSPQTTGGGGGPTGAITVTSEDSVMTSTLVSASWSFPQHPTSGDPCAVASCAGTYQLYNNMPLGQYTLSPSSSVSSTMMNYAFRSVELAPVAKKPTIGNPLADLFSNLFNTAKAYMTCGSVNNAPTTCPLLNQTLSLSGSGDTANFIILWDPVAAISVSPSTLSLSATPSSTASGQVTLTNSGGQGSTLNWTASSDKPWLTVWPASGCLNAGGKAVNGCPDTNGFQYLTLTANSSGLAAGTYTGTVAFNWTSLPTDKKDLSPTILAVTFTVGAVTPPPPSNPPSCTFGASPQQVVPPGQSTLSWTCTNAVSCQLDGATVATGGSEQVSPTTNTTYTLSCEGSGSGSTNTVTTHTTVTTQGPNVHEINP